MSIAQTVQKLRGAMKLKSYDSLWAYFGCLLPPALLLWFIARFGVNVPYMDQWGLPYLFLKIKTGTAGFGDFFAQNNEHRVLFPKLIWSALAFATKWNTKYEMWVIWALSMVTFMAIYKLALKQKTDEENVFFHQSMILTSLVVFSLMQYENWLWGFALAFILVQTCVALAVLAADSDTLSPRKRFALAALCCFIASFTVAHGLFSWLALVPMIAVIFQQFKRRVAALAMWLVLFLLSGAVYSIGFHRQTGVYLPDPLFAVKHPMEGARFFLGLLGAQFAHGFMIVPEKLATLIGSLIIALFLFCTCYLVWQKSFTRAAPWIALALFGLSFVLLTMIGRAGWGIGFGVNTSRYMSAPVFVIIGVIQMGRLICQKRLTLRALYTCAGGIMFAFILFNSAYAVSQARQIRQERGQAGLLLEILPYIDKTTDAANESCLFPLFPVPGAASWIRPPAEILNQLGFRRIRSDVAFVEHPAQNYGSFDALTTSNGTLTVKKSDLVQASGWAALPDVARLPKLVLLSYNDNRSFITGVRVGSGIERLDVAQLLKSNRYAQAGWRVEFPAKFLPPGDTVIKAWAYDPYRRQFLKLGEYGGEKRLTVKD